MLAGTSNSSFHIPLSHFEAPSSENIRIFSQFSSVSCFPPSKKIHFSSLLSPTAVIRSLRARKRRSKSSRGSRNLCNQFAVGASLAAEPGIQSEEALQQPSAPYSIKIPVGDRHVSAFLLH